MSDAYIPDDCPTTWIDDDSDILDQYTDTEIADLMIQHLPEIDIDEALSEHEGLREKLRTVLYAMR